VTVNFQLFELLNREAGRFDNLDDVMEFAATKLIYAVFALAAVLVARAAYRRQVRPIVRLGVTLVLAFAASTALGRVSREVRPFQSHHVHQLIPHAPGVSMPSDHATAAFALAFGVGLFLSRRWGVVLGIAALVIGVARVWAGVHYPGDVLAGAIIGGLAAVEVLVWSLVRVTAPGDVQPLFRIQLRSSSRDKI
jgi:undecaprenyl-diphosphatase